MTTPGYGNHPTPASTPSLRDYFRSRSVHAVDHHRKAKRANRHRAAAMWLQAAQVNADRAREARQEPNLPLPRSWAPVDMSTPAHRHIRYVPAPALATVPPFVAGILAEFTSAGRDWIVIPAAPHRDELTWGYQGDLEDIGAAMLRIVDIDLGIAGTRYVVSRATVCGLGSERHDGARYEPDGSIVCTDCERRAVAS